MLSGALIMAAPHRRRDEDCKSRSFSRPHDADGDLQTEQGTYLVMLTVLS